MKIPLRQFSKLDQSNLAELNAFARDVFAAVNEIEITQDGSTSENVFCDLVAVEFSAASGHQQFSHGLKRVPYGAIPVRMNLPCSVWWETDPTSAIIELKCSETASGTLLVF